MHRHSFAVSIGLALALGAALLLIPACGGKKETPAPEAESPRARLPRPPRPRGRDPAAAPPTTPPAAEGATQALPDPAAVAARVNGRPITERQVWGLAAIQLMQLRSRGERVPAEAEPIVRRKALEFLIDGELMAQRRGRPASRWTRRRSTHRSRR